MKKLFFTLFLISNIFISLNLNAQSAKQERAEVKRKQEAAAARGVFEIIKGKKIIALINQATPTGEKRQAIDNYPFKLINDTLNCNLPFFGSSSGSVWGTEDLAIKAINQPVSIDGKYDRNIDGYEFVFSFKSSDNTSWKCILKVFISTRVNILMEGSKSSIKYDGYLDIETIKELFNKEPK